TPQHGDLQSIEFESFVISWRCPYRWSSSRMSMRHPEVVIAFEPYRGPNSEACGPAPGHVRLTINGDCVGRWPTRNGKDPRSILMEELQSLARRYGIDFAALLQSLTDWLNTRRRSPHDRDTALALAHAFTFPWALQFRKITARCAEKPRRGRPRAIDHRTVQ